MRIYQFIPEASIFSQPARYPFGHKVKISSRNKKAPGLVSAITNVIPDFDTKEDLIWTKKSKPTYVVNYGAGDDTLYFTRANNEIIAIRGSGNVIEKILTHAAGQKGSTAENKGDLAEPILSAAVVAKLIKRGADSIEDITEEDVHAVLMGAVTSAGKEYIVNDKNSKIADTIKFTINMREPTMEYMKTPKFWESLGHLPAAAAHYANSGQIDRYADYFYKNGKADSVTVDSDGMSAQKERKTDIQAYVNGRALQNLNVSLKAGSDLIGQVGGGITKDPFRQSAKGAQGVWTNANRLFSPLGITIDRPETADGKPIPVKNLAKFWLNAYKQASEQMTEMLAGEDLRSETGIIMKMVNMVSSHGTSGDTNVKLVSLHKTGESTIHSFKGLFNKLAANDINLQSSLHIGKSKLTGEPRPELRIFDATSGPLLYIRFSSTEAGDKVWNTVEMKPLLKKLTTLTYRKTTNEPANVSTAPAPATDTIAPAAATATKVATAAIPTTTTPTAPSGPNVTKLRGTSLVPAGEEDEVEMETVGDKDLERIRHLSGIVSQMSKNF